MGDASELAEPDAVTFDAGRGGRGALNIGVDMALDTGSVRGLGTSTSWAAVGMGSDEMRTCVGALAEPL